MVTDEDSDRQTAPRNVNILQVGKISNFWLFF